MLAGLVEKTISLRKLSFSCSCEVRNKSNSPARKLPLGGNSQRVLKLLRDGPLVKVEIKKPGNAGLVRLESPSCGRATDRPRRARQPAVEAVFLEELPQQPRAWVWRLTFGQILSE